MIENVTIVKDIESNRVPSDERVLNAILKFKGSWKNEIDRINEDNRRSFQNFHCGSRLLQVIDFSDDINCVLVIVCSSSDLLVPALNSIYNDDF